jgi:hypothetical protein
MTTCACGTKLTGRQRKWCSPECAKAAARELRLADHFNLTPADYDLILEVQGGGCGICGRAPRVGKRHAVDHDHQTGYIRGLLCFRCNKVVLGARGAEILVKTAEYVTDPPARRALGRDVVAPGRPPKKRKPRGARTKTRQTRQRRAA